MLFLGRKQNMFIITRQPLTKNVKNIFILWKEFDWRWLCSLWTHGKDISLTWRKAVELEIAKKDFSLEQGKKG